MGDVDSAATIVTQVKNKLRKLRSLEFGQSAVSPKKKESLVMSPAVKIQGFKSSEGRFKGEELASTFGSDNFLNFRNKPLKRKRRRGSPVKSPNNHLFPEESDS